MTNKNLRSGNTFLLKWRIMNGLLAMLAIMVLLPAGVDAQSSGSSTTWWWRGVAGATDPTAMGNWYTTDSTSGTSSGAPVVFVNNTAGVGVFNLSASNNIAASVTFAQQYYAAGFIINNSNSVTITGSSSDYAALVGFTNGGTVYGLIANPGAGAVKLNGMQFQGSQAWVNNGSGLMTINNNGTITLEPDLYSTALATLKLGGTGNILINANVTDYSAAQTMALTYAGTGTLLLTNKNSYTGGTTISSGTVILTNVGTLGNGGYITLAAGSTLDASAVTNFSLSISNTLFVNGTGTNIGGTASAFKARTNGTINLGSSPIIMTYDGVNPALYVSQGTLSISNNPFVINTLSTLPLPNGSYVIAQQASGNINTNLANAYTITGTALSAGATTTISASNNVLYLNISNASTNSAPIKGIAPNKFYWIATNNAAFATITSWGTNSANTNRATAYPGTTPAQNNLAIFNYPASNNIATTIAVATAETFGGIIVNNTNTTTLLPTAAAAAFTLNGFTNDLSGILYGITVNAYAGSVAIGSNSATTDLPITLGRSQTWLNNGTGVLSISNTVTIPAGTNLTLGIFISAVAISRVAVRWLKMARARHIWRRPIATRAARRSRWAPWR